MFFHRGFAVLLMAALLFTACPASFAERLTLPRDMEVIEEEAFAGDMSLDEVEMPEGVKVISSRAFAESSLGWINLPSTLEYIAPDAFEGAPNALFYAELGDYAFQWMVDNHYLVFVQAEAPWTDCYNVWWLPVTGIENYTVYTYSDEACVELYRVDEAVGESAFIYTDVDTQYWFVLEYEQDGQVYRSDPVTAEPLEPMDAPENFAAVMNEDGTVHLTWDAVPGATGYRVYYSTATGDWSPEMEQIPFEGSPEDWDESWLQIEDTRRVYVWVCADNGEGSNRRAFAVAEREGMTEEEFMQILEDDGGLYLSTEPLNNLSLDDIQDEVELALVNEHIESLRQTVENYNAVLDELLEYIYSSAVSVDIGAARVCSDDIDYSVPDEAMELLSREYQVEGIIPDGEDRVLIEINVDGETHYLSQNADGITIDDDYQPGVSMRMRGANLEAAWDSMEDSNIQIGQLFDLFTDVLETADIAAEWFADAGIDLGEFGSDVAEIKKWYDALNIPKHSKASTDAHRMLLELAEIRSHMHPTMQEEMYDWTRETAEIMNSEIDAAMWGLRSEICNNWFAVHQAATAFLSKGSPSKFEEKYEAKIGRLQDWLNGKTKYGKYAKNVLRVGCFSLEKYLNEQYAKTHELYDHIKQLDARLHYDIIGVVKDKNGRSLPYALVNVLIDSSRVSFTADSSGYYAIEAPDTVTYLSFEKDGYITNGPVQVNCSPYVPARKDVVLEKGLWGTVEGTVVDEYGDPVYGASVICGEYQTLTGGDGKYSFSLPVGERTLKYSKDGYITVPKQITVFDNNEPQDATLRWKRGITGTVTDQNGPVPNASIDIKYVGENKIRYSTKTDENGKFRIMVPAREYDVHVSASNRIEASFLRVNSIKYANVTEDRVVDVAAQMYDTTGKYRVHIAFSVISSSRDPNPAYTRGVFSWDGHTVVNDQRTIEPMGFICVSDNGTVEVSVELDYEMNGVNYKKTKTKTVDLTTYKYAITLGWWFED